MPKAAGARIQQQNRRQRAAGQFFDETTQGVENDRVGIAPGDHLEQLSLSGQQHLVPLALGQVHYGSNELDAARLVAEGARDDLDMFDGAIGHHQAVGIFEIMPFPRRALDGLFHPRRVFRMHPLEHALHGRYRRRVVLEDAKRLV